MILKLNLNVQKLAVTNFILSDKKQICATWIYIPNHFISHKLLLPNTNILYLTLSSIFLNKNSKKNIKSYSQNFNKYNLFSFKTTSSNYIDLESLNTLLCTDKQKKNFYLKNFLERINFKNINNINLELKGKTIGKGFSGTIKKFNFKKGPTTHGSKNIRLPGSIGAGTTPGRVFKNKKMAGHLGNKFKTFKNIQVLEHINNLLLIKGTFPGKSKTYYSLKLIQKDL